MRNKKKGGWPGPRRSAIGKLASAITKKEFADELSTYTTLTSDEIKNLFPKKTDREELLELIKIINLDASDNEKKAELINKIPKVSGAVLKLLKELI